jgi:hypothetical protein
MIPFIFLIVKAGLFVCFKSGPVQLRYFKMNNKK